MKDLINKFLNFITTLIIILLFISVVASFQTTFLGKKYNNFFGYSLFEIKTASMSGEMEIGDWILVEVTKDVKLNDIITFENEGAFVTHRIIEKYKDTYITKGDTNTAKDTPVVKEQIVGKMVRVLPKFGIIKKTLFNTKVLIVLILTIIVGCYLFKEDETKKEEQPEKKKLKDKLIPNKEKELELKLEEIFSKEEIEKAEELTEENAFDEIQDNPKSIANTVTLSRITVDMNSKTLSSLHKKIEDTNTLEKIDELEELPVKKEKIKKEIKLTNKKILLGKNEKNLIRKGIELKENEILEIVKIILDKEYLDGDIKSITNKFLKIYIEIKYINQGDIDSNVSITTFRKNIDESIIKFQKDLLKDTSSNSTKKKIEDIANAFLLINKIDDNKINIDKIIESDKVFNFKNKKTVIKEIKKIIKEYDNKVINYFKKMSTNKFELLTKQVPKTNIYNTNIGTNIKFNKLFSNYSINKTYEDDIVTEDLRELQLKILSLKVLEDMLSLSYKKKYLINFNDSLLKKEKKLKTTLSNIDDIYSQGKIQILINIESLILNYKIITKLIKDGYKFVVELDSNDIKEIPNIRKFLCVTEYIFIKNGELSKEDILNNIPSELEDKIIYINKTLIEGPVIK